MGAFFCVCVLPFKTKFLKKIIDEEMKMKMREREREREISLGGSFFKQQCFVAEQHKETKKKKSLSLPQSSLPKSKVDNNNPPKSLFCLRKYISSRIHAV